MAVHPDEVDAARRPRPIDGAWCVTVGEVEPELRVVLARRDELVGVGVHARCDPQQHLGRRPDAGGGEGVEPVELVEGIDDDVADTGGDRRLQLGGRLVVAVQDARRRRHPGGERDVQLATRGDVEQEPFVVGEPRHRLAQERLGGVDHPLPTEGANGLAAAGAQVLLVVDEHRGAELGGEVVDTAPPDREVPVGGDPSAVGEEVPFDSARCRVHICSGASMPSRPRA